MIIIIIARAYKDKSILKFSPIFIPLTVYGSFAFLSSIISEYRSYSFTGMFDQFESVWALLGYCLVVYYVFLFVQTEQDVKFVIKYLLIGVLILGLLGLTQFVGHDFITSEFGLKLITPNYYWSNLESINNIFFNNRVYLTLFNPNYVGVYVSLILPILFTLTIFNKNLRTLPIYLLAIVGMILCLVGSQSTAGLVATIAGVLLLLILLWRYLIKYFYITIPIILLSIGALFIFNMKADNYLLKQYSKLTEIKKSEPHLTDIQTLDDSITIKYNGNTLIVKFYVDNSGICYFDLLDDKSNTLPVSFEQINGPVTVLDERFPGFVFTPVIFNDKYAFTVHIDNFVWRFTNQTEDNSYYYINSYDKLDKIITAPSAIFTGYENYASGRGYIWSRTIPLLKNNIILGAGADNFVMEFPQQDYVNLYNNNYSSIIITKPHCLYLQIGVQTGIISLIAFLIFYAMYFISSTRLYIHGRFNSYYAKIGLAVFVGTFSYMVSCISNDSSITVAPVYWVIIGLGIAVNKKAAPTILVCCTDDI